MRSTWNTANFSTSLNLNGKVDSSVAGKVNCSGKTDLLALPQVSDPLPDIILLNKLEAGQLPMCVKGNGSVQVGDLLWHLCNVTYSFCPRLNRIKCLTCMMNAKCVSDEAQRAVDCAFDSSYQMAITEGRQNVTKCSAIAPTIKERIEHHLGSRTKRDLLSTSTGLTDPSVVPWDFAYGDPEPRSYKVWSCGLRSRKLEHT